MDVKVSNELLCNLTEYNHLALILTIKLSKGKHVEKKTMFEVGTKVTCRYNDNNKTNSISWVTVIYQTTGYTIVLR